MFKNFFKYVEFFYHKIFTSKYKIVGKCNCCGACCRNIVFMIDEEYVKTEAQFEDLQKFDKKYLHFEIFGRNEHGVLLFKCKSLGNDNKCKSYFFRSLYCRAYPLVTEKIRLGGYETFETCGYKIVVNKPVDDFLKNK